MHEGDVKYIAHNIMLNKEEMAENGNSERGSIKRSTYQL